MPDRATACMREAGGGAPRFLCVYLCVFVSRLRVNLKAIWPAANWINDSSIQCDGMHYPCINICIYVS